VRIAIVFSSYQEQIPSGEREVVNLQIETLRSFGHEVLLVKKSTSNQNLGLRFKLSSFLATSLGYGHSPLPELVDWKPEVILIHNLHPNFGKKWVGYFKKKCPEVVIAFYVHNYRAFCSAGTLIRSGRPCTKCVRGSRLNGLLYKCYRNSFLGSLAFYVSFLKQVPQKDVFNQIDLAFFINVKTQKIYESAGLRFKRTVVLPNFQKRVVTGIQGNIPLKPRYYFAGRLSPEKGILPLVKNWPTHVGLDIFGDGSQRLELENLIQNYPNIKYHGAKTPTELENELTNHTILVLPSVCPEVAPMTVQSALAASRAILCLKVNEFWSESNLVPGLSINSLDKSEINEAINLLEANLDFYSRESGQFYLDHFTPEIWHEQFIREIRPELPRR